jgi:hypothetical protein
LARLVSLLLAVVCLLIAAPLALADPTPLGSASGTCHPATGTSNWSVGSVFGWDHDYDLRVTTDAGPAAFHRGSDSLSWPAAATDWSIWDLGNASSASGTITCESAPTDVHWTVAWFRPLQLPATFSGALPVGGQSELGFDAIDDGTYLVDVSVSGGSLTVFQGDTSEVVSSTGGGQFSGTAGLNEVDVENDGATPVQYTITVTEKPVVLTLAPGAPSGYARPGVSRTYGYNLSVPATMNVWVKSAPGHVVRELVDLDDESAGDHTVTWDGRDDAGAQLPDGRYTLSFGAFNQPGSSSQDLVVGIDSAPPTIATTNVNAYWHRFSATDARSGLASFLVTVDGKPVAVTKTGGSTVMNSTVSGLTPGAHTVHLVATDNAGNVQQRDVQVMGAPVGSPPPCNDALTYVATVLNAKSFTRAVAHVGHITPNRLFDSFKIHKAICTDLTGDGVRDLALMLKGRGHLRSQTPIALYKGAPGEFTYMYGDSHASYRSMSLSGRDVVLRPSHGKSRRLHWNGAGFLVK